MCTCHKHHIFHEHCKHLGILPPPLQGRRQIPRVFQIRFSFTFSQISCIDQTCVKCPSQNRAKTKRKQKIDRFFAVSLLHLEEAHFSRKWSGSVLIIFIRFVLNATKKILWIYLPTNCRWCHGIRNGVFHWWWVSIFLSYYCKFTDHFCRTWPTVLYFLYCSWLVLLVKELFHNHTHRQCWVLFLIGLSTWAKPVQSTVTASTAGDTVFSFFFSQNFCFLSRKIDCDTHHLNMFYLWF